MLQWIARLAISAPRRVVLGVLCVTIAAAVFGAPVVLYIMMRKRRPDAA